MIKHDRPISVESQDAYNFKNLSKTIANHLGSEGPNVSVSITGKWGSGKSSLLNLVGEEVKNRNDVLFVIFQPFWHDNKENMLKGILHQIRSEISDKKGKFKRSIKLLKFLYFIASLIKFSFLGFSDIVSSIEKFVNFSKLSESIDNLNENEKNRSIHETKNDIKRLLKKLNIHIVVAIDDIDRLSSEQVFEIFSISKTIMDIEGVSFILAYDLEAVKYLIKKQVYNPDIYLEKVTDVSYNVPVIDSLLLVESELIKYWHQAYLCCNQFVCDRAYLRYTNSSVFSIYLEKILKSPRDQIKFFNAVNSRLKNNPKGIDPLENLIVESIKLKFPNIWKYIQEERDFLTERMPMLYTEDQFKNKITKIEEKLKLGENSVLNNDVFKQISDLFPVLKTKRQRSDRDSIHYLRNFNICHYFNFETYNSDYEMFSVSQGELFEILKDISNNKRKLYDILEKAIKMSHTGIYFDKLLVRIANQINSYQRINSYCVHIIFGIIITAFYSTNKIYSTNKKIILPSEGLELLQISVGLIGESEIHLYDKDVYCLFAAQNLNIYPYIKEKFKKCIMEEGLQFILINIRMYSKLIEYCEKEDIDFKQNWRKLATLKFPIDYLRGGANYKSSSVDEDTGYYLTLDTLNYNVEYFKNKNHLIQVLEDEAKNQVPAFKNINSIIEEFKKL